MAIDMNQDGVPEPEGFHDVRRQEVAADFFIDDSKLDGSTGQEFQFSMQDGDIYGSGGLDRNELAELLGFRIEAFDVAFKSGNPGENPGVAQGTFTCYFEDPDAVVGSNDPDNIDQAGNNNWAGPANYFVSEADGGLIDRTWSVYSAYNDLTNGTGGGAGGTVNYHGADKLFYRTDMGLPMGPVYTNQDEIKSEWRIDVDQVSNQDITGQARIELFWNKFERDDIPEFLR